MRRVQRALKGGPLDGVAEAYRRCVSKGAISNWRRSIELMEAVQISERELKHVSPSHAEEIARRVKDRDQWPAWVKKCARGKWTVLQLREQLGASRKEETADGPVPTQTTDTYLTALKRILLAVDRARETPDSLRPSMPLIQARQKEVTDAFTQLERDVQGDG